MKCDEARPSCEQCTSKSLECPGYDPRWRWSTKHERRSTLPTRKNNLSGAASAASENPADVVAADGHPPTHSRECEALNVNGRVRRSAQADDTVPCSGQIENIRNERGLLSDSGQDQALLPKRFEPYWQNLHRPASPAPFQQDFQPVGPPVWGPPDTILSNPQVQVEFFTQKICKFLTAFDSDHNQFRIVGTSRAKESLLFFSLCRYITAAFLNSSALGNSNALVVQNAHTDMLHRLQNEVAQLDVSKHAKIEDVLMAVIMFGLATNWDGSNAPSIFHYNAAIRMYHHTYENSKANMRRGNCDNQQFFHHCLVYWWMGLAFVTDTAEQRLLEPPATDPRPILGGKSSQNVERVPHPLAGVSPEAQKLLGMVGSLIYEQRLRDGEKSFTSLSRLQRDYRALQEAQRLEEEALSMDLPSVDDFVDIADPDTPIVDLVNTAEVYRVSALLLLYRAFPDLLSVRLRLEEDAAAHDRQDGERRLSWLTGLAIHALEILCRNGPRSGTRSIEQILLVIIAGELRKPPSSSIQIYDEGNTSGLSFMSTAASSPTSVTTDSLDQYAAISRLIHPDPASLVSEGVFHDTLESDHVSVARSIVVKRLQSVREILPYKSLEIVEKLVLTTWNLSDHEKYEVFWMDIMIEKGWRFLLI